MTSLHLCPHFCTLSPVYLSTSFFFSFFFFNDPATTEIYTLSLHDALPISVVCSSCRTRSDGISQGSCTTAPPKTSRSWQGTDRKSTRLNSSHGSISYAVFCLKKKKKKKKNKRKTKKNTKYEHRKKTQTDS